VARVGRWSQSQLEAAVEAVVGGLSYKDAELLVGVPRSTIWEHVVRSGIVRGSVPRPGRRRRSGARAGSGNGRVTTTPLTMQAARGVAVSTLRGCLERQRGVMAKDRKRREGSLTASDREEIRVGIELGESDDEIARRIGRHRSTVWREIKANGGRSAYNAAGAEERAARVAARPKTPWTEQRPWLWGGPGTPAEEVVTRADRAPPAERPSRPARMVGVARSHLPGHLRPGQRRAPKGARLVPAQRTSQTETSHESDHR
jgi:predicted DNA-binding protein (UPF0251 family)